MKRYAFLIVALLVMSAGILLGLTPVQAQTPSDTLSREPSTPDQGPRAATLPQRPGNPIDEEYTDDDLDYADDPFAGESVTIADPLEPFNRAMYQFNDKLYYWVLKPVALGYKSVVPEPARISVKNFYFNMGFPSRFISCLLQADFSGAGQELGRFTINTVWGIGGFLDPSSNKEFALAKQETDFGQTLGVYGVGQGFYMVWPVLGPSSPRDSLNIAGDYFLYPLSYVGPWYTSFGIRPIEMINSASLRIGDYESLQGAAIDPYVSIRDAYVQYRLKRVKARQARSLIFRAEPTSEPATDQSATGK